MRKLYKKIIIAIFLIYFIVTLISQQKKHIIFFSFISPVLFIWYDNIIYSENPFPNVSIASVVTINAFLSICFIICFISATSFRDATQNNITFCFPEYIPFE